MISILVFYWQHEVKNSSQTFSANGRARRGEEWGKAGLRLATFFGFIVAVVSFTIGLFYLVAKLLFWQRFAAGYAPMMVVTFFMGGVQLAFLGFMGEYVMAINTRVMNRPLVVEEERINFPDAP